jgi:lipopolysaccharide/colanic/teichoic acid biosynthesis glycosyltransferase
MPRNKVRVTVYDSGRRDRIVSSMVVRVQRSAVRNTPRYRRAKRVLDLALTAPMLLALAPVVGGIALAIRLEDGGPVLFRQERAGEGGRPFTMFKFRSMCLDAEARKAELFAKNEAEGGVIFKMREDPRVTRVGKLLRRFSLDELPQLFNVMLGDMSLVGPRPHPVAEAASYPEEARSRLEAKPGLTCLWQVMGRSLVPFHEQVKLDKLYVEHQSLSLDLRLLARTARAVLSGLGAY